jgi:membrane protein
MISDHGSSATPREASSRLGTLGAAAAWFIILKLLSPTDRGISFDGANTRNKSSTESSKSGFAEKPNAADREVKPEAGRGRHADSPEKIPSAGWKDIFWRTYQEFGKDRVMALSAGVTYYSLLAIFPAIAALVSLYGLFADPGTIEEHLKALSGILPGGALEIVGEQVKRIASQGGGTLGFSFVFGLVVALWSANAGMKAIFDALNIVYDEDEKRSFLKLNAMSLAFTAGALAFGSIAMGMIVVLPIVFEFVGLTASTEWLIRLGRWPLLLLCVVGGLAALYRYAPSRKLAKWRWVTPGGLVAALLWIVVSVLFSWYVSNFGSYNETYGSLGAVIGFMTWIWASTIVVLLGAEINAEIEHQTADDTTEGPRTALGSRGAEMADTVGLSKA